MKRLARTKQQGQGLAEYGLILALIAVIAIGTLTTMGNQVKTSLLDISSNMQTTTSPHQPMDASDATAESFTQMQRDSGYADAPSAS